LIKHSGDGSEENSRPCDNGKEFTERFDGRISEILHTTHFHNAEEFAKTLVHYRQIYNHHIPRKVLGHIIPVAALKE